jgi:glutamate carboxypeptidase
MITPRDIAPEHEQRLIAHLESREQAYIERLRKLVDHNSGIDNPEGRLACLTILEQGYKLLGFACERIEKPGGMVHLVARRPALGKNAANAPKILILGHFDTVYDANTTFLSFTREGQLLRGPGVGDMKGGLVVAQAALEAINATGQLGEFDWLCVHNADEEVQSPTSRELIEQLAMGRDFCMDFEIGRKTGAVVRSRAGVGRYFITTHGKAAHAGMDHADGVNAIVAMARIVEQLAALGDAKRGTTINVGTIHGGQKRNIVPDLCKIEVDVRVLTTAEGARIDAEVRRICAEPPIQGARVDVLGGIGRPPWQRNAQCEALIFHFQHIARAFGVILGAEDTGGGSDANFTAAMGIATIDGLGPIGEGPHTFEERIEAHTIIERAKLVALAVMTWTRPDTVEWN